MERGRKTPLCRQDRPDRPLDRKDVAFDGWVKINNDTRHVTRYRDGSERVHWGGPGGVSYTDENGEET